MDTVIPINSSMELGERGPIREYFYIVREVLLEPGVFFRKLSVQYSTNQAISFGLLSIWLSSLISFIWGATNKILFMNLLDAWLDGAAVGDDTGSIFSFSRHDFLIDGGLLLASPFFSLLGLYFSALVLLSFAKLFILDDAATDLDQLQTHRKSRTTFNESLRILGFASIGTWLSIVPIVGGILSYFVVLLLAMVGVRECFNVSTKRAMLVIFVPQFIFFMMLVLLAGAAILFIAVIPWDQLSELQSIGGGGAEDVDSILQFSRNFFT